jgi:hypothetical protein
VLEKLKEYKEVITIIIFFLGGFFWLQNEFPKKSDLNSEIGSVQCLLQKYMTLTQLQIRSQELDKQIQELGNQIRLFPAASNDATHGLTPAMAQELDEKKSDLSDKKKDLRENKLAMEKIVEELARNACGKVPK